jgi:hypothetical protein
MNGAVPLTLEFHHAPALDRVLVLAARRASPSRETE